MLFYLLAMIDDENDQTFFTDLYENYQKQMISEANKILHDNYLAEDAVQDVFERIIKNIKTVRSVDESKIRSYLFISAKHAAIDIMKKRRDIVCDNLSPVYNELIDDEIIAKENLSFALDILNKMPEKYREVLRLRLFLGAPTKETAQILNINENTVRQQLSRGKTMFTEKYNRELMKFEKK